MLTLLQGHKGWRYGYFDAERSPGVIQPLEFVPGDSGEVRTLPADVITLGCNFCQMSFCWCMAQSDAVFVLLPLLLIAPDVALVCSHRDLLP